MNEIHYKTINDEIRFKALLKHVEDWEAFPLISIRLSVINTARWIKRLQFSKGNGKFGICYWHS